MAQRTPTRRSRAQTNGDGRRRSLAAAAREVRIDQRDEVKKVLAMREDWQSLAFDYNDAIGEVKSSVTYQGDAMSKLRLYPALRPESAVDDPPEDEDPRAIEAVDRLRGVTGDHSELLRELAVQLTIPGACWLVGLSERTITTPSSNPERPAVTEIVPERWFISSIEEVQEKNERVVVEDPETGDPIVLRRPSDVDMTTDEPDFIARVWRRHPRRARDADSALRGVLGACEELLIVDRAFRSIERSRITFGSILYVPDDISFGNTDPTTDAAGAEEEDPFEVELLEVFTTPIRDEGSAAAVAPIILRGPRREDGSGIEPIELKRQVDEILDKRGERALRRIAQGLNLPVELVFGLGEANHWGAGQIEKQAFRQYLEPLAILIVDALTISYYRRALLAAGMSEAEAARRFLWYDPMMLIVDDRKTSIGEAHDRLVISDDTYRQVLGFGEEDAPDEEEYERRTALKRGIFAGDLTEALLRRTISPDLSVPHLLPSGGIVETPEGEPIAEPLPTPADGDVPAEDDETSDSETAESVAAAVVPDLGRRLVEIDRMLRERLSGALDTAVRDTLSRLGNRLANRAQKDARTAAVVRHVPPMLVAATLGRDLVASLEEPAETLERGADSVRDRFYAWVEEAQSAALALVPGVDEGERSIIESEQRTDRDEAWSWLRQALIDLMNERLYSPQPEAPPEGEFNPNTTVPPDVVREAIARAGGAARAERRAARTASLYARLTGIARAFGIGTGPVMQRAMDAEGLGIEGYRWEYGPAARQRPFEPHRALDGVEFENFDDPMLAVRGSFPETGFYMPGDHAGCICDVVPVIIERRR